MSEPKGPSPERSVPRKTQFISAGTMAGLRSSTWTRWLALKEVCTQSPPTARARDELAGYRDLLTNRLHGQVGEHQLLVDVSEVARVDYGGGIQRVTNRLLGELLFSPPPGYRVLPIRLTDAGDYVHARQFLCDYIGIVDASLEEDPPIEVSAGDCYLGLDLIRDRAELAGPALSVLRERGAHIAFVVYDLLPFTHPQWFPPGIDIGYNKWLRLVAEFADTALCISQSVCVELRQALQEIGATRVLPAIVNFRLGADFAGWTLPKPVLGAPSAELEGRFLMVGTVERRKGHGLVLDAFEKIWAEGRRVQLVIAGKPGWLVEDLLERLRQHPLKGHLLHWFETVDDQTLVGLYHESTALLAASEGEGFGLPLTEAAWHGLPILAHDLPVFREVAGCGADYFQGDAAELGLVLLDYLDRAARGRVANPYLSRPCSWHDSAEALKLALGLPQVDDGNSGTDIRKATGTAPRHPHQAAATAMKKPVNIDALMQSIREELSSVPSSRGAEDKPSPKAATPSDGPDIRPSLSVDEIMRRVRAEVARRHGVLTPEPDLNATALPDGAGSTQPEREIEVDSYVSASAATEHAKPGSGISPGVYTVPVLHRWEPAAPRLVAQSQYILSDLLAYSDDDFVDTAFAVLLRREAVAAERSHYLQALRNGTLGKVEILASLRWSEEGKAHAVHVDGLLAPYLLQRAQRWPVVGPALSWVLALARLPALRRRLNLIDANQGWETHALGQGHNRLVESVESELAELSARLMEQELAVATQMASQEKNLQELHALALQMRDHLDMLDIRTRGLPDLQSVVVAQGSRLGTLQHRVGEEVASLTARLESESERGNQVEATLAEVRNGLDASVQALGGRIDTELAGLAARLESESERGNQVEATLVEVRNGLDASVQALGGRIDTELAGLTARLESESERGNQVEATLAEVRNGLDASVQALSGKIDAEFAGLAARVEAAAQHVTRLETLEAQVPGLHESLGQLLATGSGLSLETADLRATLSTKVDNREIAGLVREVADLRFSGVELQRRFGVLLEEARRRLPAELDPDQLQKFASEGAHRLDAMYASFEEDFRGTRENIMDRARHYLEPVTLVGAGSPEAPVLDLGCGRGEWLELLKEHGLTGRGIDLNDVFIAQCRSRGLDVVESDVLAYLRDLPDASVGAITSMHLVEHLPMGVLVDLLDEAMRVLRPGGLIALETPNPENLLVGAHYFYMDPTHRNPLPPALLQWLVAARGFEQTRVDRLSEHRGTPGIVPVDESVPGSSQINTFVELIRTAPDYAVVATKPERRAVQAVAAHGKKSGRHQ